METIINGDGYWTSTWTLDSDGETEGYFGDNALEFIDDSQEPRTRLVNRSCVLLSFANWTFVLSRCTSLFSGTPSATFPEPKASGLQWTCNAAQVLFTFHPLHRIQLHLGLASVLFHHLPLLPQSRLSRWARWCCYRWRRPRKFCHRRAIHSVMASLFAITFLRASLNWPLSFEISDFSSIISRVTLDTARTPVPPVASV